MSCCSLCCGCHHLWEWHDTRCANLSPSILQCLLRRGWYRSAKEIPALSLQSPPDPTYAPTFPTSPASNSMKESNDSWKRSNCGPYSGKLLYWSTLSCHKTSTLVSYARQGQISLSVLSACACRWYSCYGRWVFRAFSGRFCFTGLGGIWVPWWLLSFWGKRALMILIRLTGNQSLFC